ncbi:signal peptidase, endoplasmic reticulum-type [Halogranum amylolyticum]|uniref:Signal peptidase, endoplasmic reticulum-type n=1 Tax=Halogranum amylolyticum TaxID=660520 RepID=A0A1H8NA19_9EURY|nr:S26 family signal peptidase [Halogranum amylolyticum]SEO26445.1 signal peptidase, endoplasmic reticulum-type [Halogranum amylolyticum]
MNASPKQFLRDTLQTVLLVALLAGLLFAASGVWPPMVAVESGSMEPHMERGDLVVVTAPDRWTATATPRDSGVVTADRAGGYERFGAPGDVVVYVVPDRRGSPIIHRAHFYVRAGEDWYVRADPEALPAGVDDCTELLNCPAPHSGYVTKGDANAHYDQANGIAPPVKEEWVVSKGRFRVPLLGWVRLLTAVVV